MATDYIEVTLTRGKIALVSPEDAERVLAFKWCATPASHLWYAVRGIRDGSKTNTQSMHRFILNLPMVGRKNPGGFEVDHKDGNGLNNTRENIRLVTKSINKHRKHKKRTSTGFYGVERSTCGPSFCAFFTSNQKKKYIGSFPIPEQAAEAYDQKVLALYGEYAMTNFLWQKKDGAWSQII